METKGVVRLRVEHLLEKRNTIGNGQELVMELTTIQTDLVLELNDVEPTSDRPHAEAYRDVMPP